MQLRACVHPAGHACRSQPPGTFREAFALVAPGALPLLTHSFATLARGVLTSLPPRRLAAPWKSPRCAARDASAQVPSAGSLRACSSSTIPAGLTRRSTGRAVGIRSFPERPRGRAGYLCVRPLRGRKNHPHKASRQVFRACSSVQTFNLVVTLRVRNHPARFAQHSQSRFLAR